MEMELNGKMLFVLWAHNRKSGKVINGKSFHLNPTHLKHFCGVLADNGWKVNQIKRRILK